MEFQRPHVALVSSPGLGHLIPMIELGNRIVLHHNFKVTILAVTSQTSEAESHILKSSLTTNPSLCHILSIPTSHISALIPAEAAVVTRLCVTMREIRPALVSALSNTIKPRPNVLIVDIFGTESLCIAQDLNMLKYVFVASHAWFLALCAYVPFLDKQVEGQYAEQTEPLRIPGCSPVRPEDVVDPMLDRINQQYREYLGMGNGIPKGDGILVNTWEELQHKDLEALRNKDYLGGVVKVPVYGVGPVVRPPASLEGPERELLGWLDQQPSETVIYVSFGSGGTLSWKQTTEVAWGLELSERRFIWVVRPPTGGSSGDAAFFGTGYGSTEREKLSKYLPEGFLWRTKEVGRVVSEWAPQVAILRHPSVGGFLTHGGWNSTLESITNGVPMIVWPLYSEQRMNATMLAEEMGVAVRTKVLPVKKAVEREEIAGMIREIMEVEKEGRRNRIRERARELKRSAEEALGKDGSSYAALSELAKQWLATCQTS